MMRGSMRAVLTAASMAAAIAVSGYSAEADILVLNAKGAQLKRGTVLKDGEQLDLGPGAMVTVVLPSGSTRTINGPAKLAVRDLSRGEPIDQALWNMVNDFVTGGGSSSTTVGAVRSAPKAAAASPPFSWTQVPVEVDGDICVERGASLTLLRSAAAKGTRVTVVDVQSNARADVRFADGTTTAPWPTQLAPKVGTFAMLMEDRPMRQIRLRLVDPLPAAEQTLRLLYGQRCQLQADAWLRGATKE